MASTEVKIDEQVDESSSLLPKEVGGKEPQNEAYGYALMLLSAVFFEVMGLIARASTAYYGVSVPNMVFLRGSVQLFLGTISAFTFADSRSVFGVPRNLLPLLALRGLFGATSLALTYFALSLIPLGVCTSLFFLNPIFTILLSSLTIGERVSRREIIAVISTITGVMLISNPTFEAPTNLSPSYVLGVCVVLTSSVIVSVAFVTIRAMGKRVHFLANVIVFGTSTATIGMILGGATTLPGFTKGIILALFGCMFGFFGQCCLNLGFQYCRASTGSLLRTVDVPLAYFLGLVFLGEVPHFVSLIGSAIVIAGNIVVGLGSMQGAKREEVERIPGKVDEQSLD